MWCIVQLLGVLQDALNLGRERLDGVNGTADEVKTSFRLTFLKTTTPFSLGEVSLRSQSGQLCMTQTKTAENLARVTVGIATSTPSIRSPWKSGNDNWSNEVANKNEAIVSALKHWKPR
jgi:hypothetical protein